MALSRQSASVITELNASAIVHDLLNNPSYGFIEYSGKRIVVGEDVYFTNQVTIPYDPFVIYFGYLICPNANEIATLFITDGTGTCYTFNTFALAVAPGIHPYIAFNSGGFTDQSTSFVGYKLYVK